MDTEDNHVLPLSAADSDIKEHPLYVPILNAMIECSVAGIKSDGLLSNRSFTLPFSIVGPLQPSPIDQFMFDTFESQWSHKTELEMLHSSVQDFCKTTSFNISKSTQDFLKCTYEDIEERTASFKVPAPFLPDHASQPCFPPPPISVPDMSSLVPHNLMESMPQSSPANPKKRKGKKNAKSLPKDARAVLKAWILGMLNCYINLIIVY